MDEDEIPKYRLEYASNGMATCQQAACKRAHAKIEKGALRIGVYTFFEQESKYITQWRHWTCATSFQLRGLNALGEGVIENVPGFANLSPESQEQVRNALEAEKIVDKEYTDNRIDLIKPYIPTEIRNAVDYKVDVASRAAGCRSPACKTHGIKITKGELRLGIATMWDEDHETWCYKHWKCITELDIEGAKGRFEQGTFDGIDELSEAYKQVVLDTFEQGHAIEPPSPPTPPAKAKRSRKRKREVDLGDFSEPEIEQEAPPPKKNRGRKSKQQSIELEQTIKAESLDDESVLAEQAGISHGNEAIEEATELINGEMNNGEVNNEEINEDKVNEDKVNDDTDNEDTMNEEAIKTEHDG